MVPVSQQSLLFPRVPLTTFADLPTPQKMEDVLKEVEERLANFFRKE
jgi:hypothetical protein